MAGLLLDGKKPANSTEADVGALLGPGTGSLKLTKGTAMTRAARALQVGTPGTANMTFLDGSVVANFPLVQGLNSVAIQALATGGTADDIWALY